MKVFSNWLMKMPSFCICSVIRVLKESGNPYPYPFRHSHGMRVFCYDFALANNMEIPFPMAFSMLLFCRERKKTDSKP